MTDVLAIEGTPYVMLRTGVWSVGGRIVFAPDEVGWWLAHQPTIRAWLDELGDESGCAEKAAGELLGFALNERCWESFDVGEFLFIELWGSRFHSPAQFFELLLNVIGRLTDSGLIEREIGLDLRDRMHGAFDDFMWCYGEKTEEVRRAVARKHS